MKLYNLRLWLCVLVLLSSQWGISILAQNQMIIKAELNVDNNEISIHQQVVYQNTSNTTLNTLYFNDWISSYSTPFTPLSNKFLNEFQTDLYVAKAKDRGVTTIRSIVNTNTQKALHFSRPKDHYDILNVQLDKPLLPNQSIRLDFSYSLKIQSDRFTGFGVTKTKDFFLNNWVLTPCVFENQEWKLYSNHNFDDLYCKQSDVELQLTLPKTHYPQSILKQKLVDTLDNRWVFHFGGDHVNSHKIFVTKKKFKSFQINDRLIETNISHKKITTEKEAIILERIYDFLTQKLNLEVPQKIVLSQVDFQRNSLYGLALLPDILSPFSKEFEYELGLAKSLINLVLKDQMRSDPRQDYWLTKGLQMLIFMDYIDTFYPNQKLTGKLSKVWGLRHFNFSKLNYNEQFGLTYYQMMRKGRDQALLLPKENLLNFNERFASNYKSAIALTYLTQYVELNSPMDWIPEFITNNNSNEFSTHSFKEFMTSKTHKNLDWFFDHFLKAYYNADYKITSIDNRNDSTYINIKNLSKGAYPITLTTLKDSTEISNQWIEGFTNTKTVAMAQSRANTFILNQHRKTPEFNLNNNQKRTANKFIFNKPLQLRLFRDIENPNYNQLYCIPMVEFQNVYDGLKLGVNINNKGLLSKPLVFAVIPSYGMESETITGSAKLVYNKYHEDQSMFHSMYGISLNRSSYNYGDFISKIQPFVQFTFRDRNNLRSNKTQQLTWRYINIQKDNSRSLLDPNDIPPYDVFNVRYTNLKNDIQDYKRWQLDTQISSDFGKLSATYEIRKRTPKNKYFNLRLFAGTFVYNRLPDIETNFSFALDRPTDYLFEYNYLGQSESKGFLSQQLIIADGGFKSKLQPAFANQWMTTLNASASIWRYIQAYGDFGVLKNRNQNLFWGYDTGIRIDLVTDYFEIYFPVYSNLGWEISQSQYSNKIRFVFTSDLSKLSRLFTRKWF